uniref:PROP1-like PPR domain-containing protein n=1 Tax=Peronospora matthiolae TaxID=2874970 RepID=A0AAV1V578_9STRA
MTFRRLLLRPRHCTRLVHTTVSASIDASSLPRKGIQSRHLAVLSSNNGQCAALDRLFDVSKRSWRLRAVIQDVKRSLPMDRGRRFYNRRLVETLEQSDYNRAWGILETLHRRYPDKSVLWPYTYNLMLRHYCKQQKTLMDENLTRVLTLLDVMVDYSCANETSFQVAMAACSRARHLRSARHVLEKMQEAGENPDARIYGFLVNCCARRHGLVKTAEEYFDKMLDAGIKPTSLVVNALLRVYARDCGRSKVMMKLVDRAYNEFGLVPDTVTTRTMVYYLLREGDVDGAVDYVRNVERLFVCDVTARLPVKHQVVNALIDASRQRGKWNHADYALTLVTRTDVTGVSAASIVEDMQNSRKLEKLVAKRDTASVPVAWVQAKQDWSQMTRREQQSYFLRRNQRESFERALEITHLCTTPLIADRAIERLSLKLESKLRLLDELICTGTASVAHFNTVLGACGKQGQLASAVSVFTKMKRYAKTTLECAPTTWSYNALLNAYAVCGDVRGTESIVTKMVENDVQLDEVTMNTILKAHVTNLKNDLCGNWRTRFDITMQALSFFEWCTEDRKLDPGAATYYSLFRLFATYLETSSRADNDPAARSTSEESCNVRERQDDELIASMGEFISTTCHDAPLGSLDIGVFNNAFNYYCQLGDVDKSFRLFDTMKKRGFQPNDTTLGLMFATCASQQQFEVGLRFLDYLMTTDGYKPTLKILSGAMQLCANSKNPDGALELFRAIEMSGTFSPTVETYEPLVFAYARVGNVTRAWEIANEMEEKLGRASISIHNRILLACVEAALPGRALEVLGVIRLKEGVSLDVISYNTALEAFVRAGERAAWWRKNKSKWEEEDIFCDGNAEYDTNEDGWDDDKYVERDSVAEGRAVVKAGLERAHSIDECTVKALSAQDHEHEQREKAAWVRESVMNLLDEMRRDRVKPDKTTFERAIAACSVNQDSEGVISVFDTLIDRRWGDNAVELKSDLMTESSFSAYLVECTTLRDKDRVLEAPTLLHKWHAATGQVPPVFVVMQMLDSLEDLGEWRRAVRMLPEWQTSFGVAPSVSVFNRVMQMCNRAEEYQLVASIFATMQDTAAYRVHPDAESYVQRIYADEQSENWVAATDLFVEMQKRCPRDEISRHQLQKIALGRYRLRQSET